MNYLTNLFGGGNAAGGMRMPQMGTGMDLYGGQPSMQTALGAMQALGGLMGKPEQQAPMPQMEMPQLPMGSNQSYEELLKMYGVRSGGLLG